MMKLEALDLNLLLAFDTLARERSVTRAAAQLNVSQPAMSGALARLRTAFDDALFVRERGGMRPTPRARQLIGPIGDAITRLREALEPEAGFQPRLATLTITIAASDYVEALDAASIHAVVRHVAPRVSIRFLRPPELFLPPEDLLRAGEADVALGLFANTVRPRHDLLSQPLLGDRVVAVVRAAHPGVSRTLKLRAFLRIPQIRVLYSGGARQGVVDTVLAALGHTRDVGLTVAHFAPVPAIVARSDLLGIVPERLARLWVRAYRLRILELPVTLPDTPLTMVWHVHRDIDPIQRWARGLIAQAVQSSARSDSHWEENEKAPS